MNKLLLAFLVCFPGAALAQPFSPAGQPIGNTGTCNAGVVISGNSVYTGTWTSTAVCNINGTIIISGMPSTSTGYACDATDRTTVGVRLRQSASTVTSATFTVDAVNMAANDVVQFGCMPY